MTVNGTIRRILHLLLFVVILVSVATVCADEARWPAPVKSPKTNGKLRVDANHTKEGYFQASISKKSKKKMKMRVVKGKESLTYDLNSNGDYEVFPFQLGDGKYEITLYENISGKKYSTAGKINVTVKLTDENSPFLYPNQYVNYTQTTKAVAAAADLCKDKKDDESFTAVCDYMRTRFVYDYLKATTVKPGMLPDIEGSWDKHMGVCQDLSAIMACMLRTQGIPCRLVIGYADKQYHAWITAVVNGKEEFYDPTNALSAIKKPRNYSVERCY